MGCGVSLFIYLFNLAEFGIFCLSSLAMLILFEGLLFLLNVIFFLLINCARLGVIYYFSLLLGYFK